VGECLIWMFVWGLTLGSLTVALVIHDLVLRVHRVHLHVKMVLGFVTCDGDFVFMGRLQSVPSFLSRSCINSSCSLWADKPNPNSNNYLL
jgi:dolichyl-phosphate-mannose--protein O-mannosyl transferase